MNFLSHYYIRHQISNPNFALGKIIPDMMRQFGPENKLRKAENRQELSEEWMWIEKGAFVHLEADRHFHNSKFFEKKTALIKHQLHDVLSMDKFIFFVAHVLLEMMLDRLLIKHKIDVAETFYDQLKATDKATISDFFRYKELKLDEDLFFQNLQRFTNARYLFHYQENDGIVYSLERVLGRVSIEMFGKMDKNRLINVISEMEATLQPDFLSIFNELENTIPE